jgi:hypothetical protein
MYLAAVDASHLLNYVQDYTGGTWYKPPPANFLLPFACGSWFRVRDVSCPRQPLAERRHPAAPGFRKSLPCSQDLQRASRGKCEWNSQVLARRSNFQDDSPNDGHTNQQREGEGDLVKMTRRQTGRPRENFRLSGMCGIRLG